MTKPKLTKHEDDIRRGIRQPERFDPKSKSVDGRGPWRMVKCKDGAYVCFEQHEEIIDNIRKKADISPPQSPHDGIHTCSKGCKKPGCTRTLRDTIEEQDKQIEALKRDVLEKTTELRNHKEVVADLRISAEDDLDSIETARTENARLKAEVERLTKAGDAMASSIQFNEEMAQDYNGPTIVHKSVQRWNAAKDGKTK
jgi:hypothetical protein